MFSLDTRTDSNVHTRLISHYHGDKVRILFIAAAILMIVMLPFFSAELPITPAVSIFVAAILGLAAGFTSPRQQWVLVADLVIALIGMLSFAYFGVLEYQEHGIPTALFWINEALAIMLIAALYYSAKTVRAIV